MFELRSGLTVNIITTGQQDVVALSKCEWTFHLNTVNGGNEREKTYCHHRRKLQHHHYWTRIYHNPRDSNIREGNRKEQIHSHCWPHLRLTICSVFPQSVHNLTLLEGLESGISTGRVMTDDGEPSGTAGKPIHSSVAFSGLDKVMVVVISKTIVAEDIKQDYDTGEDGIAMVSFEVDFDRLVKLEETIKANCSRELVFYKR
ncbi:hypothetical protein PVK06_037603 [Gossypium arboreum]|uniref:Uncharacterized protein n=1 Tax=Gossypium arboreum TaxID=29729 RepID=A0ABR0MXT2_GOSAR|nr:hypothetical protein PVK06_037603 [Gossypium arboreum]